LTTNYTRIVGDILLEGATIGSGFGKKNEIVEKPKLLFG